MLTPLSTQTAKINTGYVNALSTQTVKINTDHVNNPAR